MMSMDGHIPCQKCGKRPATIHLTEIVDSKKVVRHLCEQCARQEDDDDVNPSPVEMLAKLLGSVNPSVRELLERQCPDCGMTFLEFKQTARLGCARDYELFEDGLVPILKQVHEATRHTGRAPASAGEAAKAASEAARLHRELDEAVKVEDYERAARLRDRIKELRGQGDEC